MTYDMDVKEAIKVIDSLIADSHQGLPLDVFLFAIRITPHEIYREYIASPAKC